MTKLLRNVGVLAAAGVLAAMAGASCGGSENPKAPAPGGSGGGGGTGGAGGGTNTCAAGGGGGQPCPEATCKLAITSQCMALADNSKESTWGLRFSQIIVKGPPALATTFIQKTVVTANVDLNFVECDQFGKGQFTWLMQWDSKNKKLRTGGAPPIPDAAAAQKGTCFIQFKDSASGKDVGPVDVDLAVTEKAGECGTFGGGAPVKELIVPIYLDAKGTSVVLLPLHQVKMKSVAGEGMSADHNCIGRYNGAKVSPGNSCIADDDQMKEGTYTWVNGGELTAYITVKEADTVNVKDLGQSLCVVLSGDPTKYADVAGPDGIKRCKKDPGGNPLPPGDWDSQSDTAKPGGDAWQLLAQFSASAIKITGTATKLDCSDAK